MRFRTVEFRDRMADLAACLGLFRVYSLGLGRLGVGKD